MKNLMLILTAGVILSGQAQNLVYNGDFELYIQCPNTQGQGDLAAGWHKSFVNNLSSNGSHTDYLNSCHTSVWGVPSNAWGNESAHSGDGYIGLAPLWPPLGTDYRENMYTHLIQPLTIGAYYEVSFYVSHADNFPFYSNNLGVQFSMTNQFAINNVSEVFETSVVYVSTGWYKVTGKFQAIKPYEYMAIGNFFDDGQTLVTNVIGQPTTNNGTLYYIDDVEVVQVGPKNAVVGINETPTEILEFNCSPSQIEDQFTVSYSIGNTLTDLEISIISLDGKLIQTIALSDDEQSSQTIDASALQAGIYFCQFKAGDQVLKTKKIIKN